MIESGTIPRKKRNARADVHDAQALDMRLGGASYRQISKALGVPLATAHRHVQRMLTEYAVEPATQLRDMEVARLDRLLAAHWGKATKGDVNATRMVLTIMDRRAKLLGLDAPQKLDVTGWIREMAEAEGIDPDQAVRDAESIVRRSGAEA